MTSQWRSFTSTMTSNIQVTLEGKGPVTLRPNDHIATGGEGSIYRVGDLAVKMYLDPQRQRHAGLPDKIKLLSVLQHPYVVAPRGLVLNSVAEPVGHYLPFVDKGHVLSMVFTNEFWAKEGLNDTKASELVNGMRETVEFAHQHQALLVDANELNWFAMINGTVQPRVIDVDSWAIGRWPASVIMPSIRDWNSKDFNDGTDWFAWACVTFQIYTGIHPYKGTLTGFDRGDLIGRMKARASVFMPGIRLNRAVREFSTVPGALLKWYEAVFQQKERSCPPSPYDKSMSAAPAARNTRMVTVAGGGALVMDRLFSGAGTGSKVTRVFHCGIALQEHGGLVDLRAVGKSLQAFVIAAAHKDCEVVRVESGWLVGDKGGFRYISESHVSEILSLQVQHRQFLSYENRLFAVTERGLVEIQVKLFGQKPIASVGQTWGIMVNSTKWFHGMGVLDAMGAMFLILPFGKESVAQIRVPDLDGLRVIAGKAGNRSCSVIANKQGDYVKLEFTFDKDYALPPKIWSGPADGPELNLAILPKGVCATILKDGELDIFTLSGQMRRVEDGGVSTDMALANWGDNVVYLKNGEVWGLKLK